MAISDKKVVLALVVSAVLAVLLLCDVDAVNPGLKVAVTQSGLTYAHTVGLLYLSERLSGKVLDIPNVSGEKDSIEYTVSNIQISGISIPDGSISIVPSAGVSISTTGLSAKLTASWSAREKVWPHPHGSGNAEIDISSTSASTTIRFGVSADGHPTATAQGTTANVGSVSLHFSGSKLDFLLNLLKKVFEDLIKNDATKAIENEVNNEIDTGLNNLLATWPTVVKIGPIAEADYSLVAPEVFTAQYMTLEMKGEIYSQSSHSEAPFSPSVFPDPTGGNLEAQVFVSDYTMNTAAYVYWKANALQGVITSAMVPPQSPIQLNTSAWQSIVPELYKAYPGWNMQITVQTSASPQITFSTTTGVQGVVVGDMLVQVINPKSLAITTAFVMRVNAVGDATMAIQNNNITAKITFFNSSFVVASSNIGPFNPAQLDGILLFAIEGIVVPYINNFLSVGFPLPALDGLRLVGPTVTVQNGYLDIATSFYYPPPSSAAAPHLALPVH